MFYHDLDYLALLFLTFGGGIIFDLLSQFLNSSHFLSELESVQEVKSQSPVKV